MKSYFSSAFLDFFKDLAANNHKEWFDANRKTYEKEVKTPFHHFIQDLIHELRQADFVVAPDAKDAIFRINRDIRFSKDKTPYKLYTSALLSPQGRKAISHPGFYIEFNPEHLGIYGGLYAPDNQQIAKVRQHIVHFPDAFHQVIEEPMFKEKFGTIQGDKQVRLPKEWKDEAEKQPLLYNKQWYIMATLPTENIVSPHIMETMLTYYKTALPLHEFIKDALDS